MGQLYRVRGFLTLGKQKRLTLSRPNEATEIFFIGMGNAFYGVANLLINRGKHCWPHSTIHNTDTSRNALQTSKRRNLFRRREPRSRNSLPHTSLALKMV